MGTAAASRRDLRLPPKAHLHPHLEGAMRPSTLQELASRHGLEVPPVRGYGDFTAFEATYRAACQVLRSPEDLQRLVLEVAEDAAQAGAIWVEPSEWLTGDQARRLGLAGREAVLEVLLDAARRAEEQTGVGVGLMVAANRTADPEDAMQLAQLAARYAGRGVVSFGLAGDESRGSPEPFTEAFALARAAGLVAAPHAGELAGAQSVRAAVDALGARRVQHGVRAIEEPELMERLAKDRICFDVCPTSNLLLSVVPSLGQHPLPELLEAGVPVSINSDDPLLFGSDLAQAYEVCRTVFGLDDAALASIATSSILASDAPEATKSEALRGVRRWLAAPRPRRARGAARCSLPQCDVRWGR
jgi:adenosine deaminase